MCEGVYLQEGAQALTSQSPHACPQVLHDTLLRALRQALHHTPQLAEGLVMDSLRSRYVPPATALKVRCLCAFIKGPLPSQTT